MGNRHVAAPYPTMLPRLDFLRASLWIEKGEHRRTECDDGRHASQIVGTEDANLLNEIEAKHVARAAAMEEQRRGEGREPICSALHCSIPRTGRTQSDNVHTQMHLRMICGADGGGAS